MNNRDVSPPPPPPLYLRRSTPPPPPPPKKKDSRKKEKQELTALVAKLFEVSRLQLMTAQNLTIASANTITNRPGASRATLKRAERRKKNVIFLFQIHKQHGISDLHVKQIESGIFKFYAR